MALHHLRRGRGRVPRRRPLPRGRRVQGAHRAGARAQPPVHARRRAPAQPDARVSRVPGPGHARGRAPDHRRGRARDRRPVRGAGRGRARRRVRPRPARRRDHEVARRPPRRRRRLPALGPRAAELHRRRRPRARGTRRVHALPRALRGRAAAATRATTSSRRWPRPRSTASNSTDEEIFSFVRLVFAAGTDTTFFGLGNALFALLTHPEQLERVVAEPDRRAALGRRGGAALGVAGEHGAPARAGRDDVVRTVDRRRRPPPVRHRGRQPRPGPLRAPPTASTSVAGPSRS